MPQFHEWCDCSSASTFEWQYVQPLSSATTNGTSAVSWTTGTQYVYSPAWNSWQSVPPTPRANDEYERVANRAEALLRSCLTSEQLAEYERDQSFTVQGKCDRYRIRGGTLNANIDVIREGKLAHRLCVHPDGVPVEDAMLAQKLWLEADEDAIVARANIRPVPQRRAA